VSEYRLEMLSLLFSFSLFKNREYLLISAKDHISQDLLQYVEQSNDFIHHARLNQGKVLIHWYEF
jgi:protein-tyrosine phosphatase